MALIGCFEALVQVSNGAYGAVCLCTTQFEYYVSVDRLYW